MLLSIACSLLSIACLLNAYGLYKAWLEIVELRMWISGVKRGYGNLANDIHEITCKQEALHRVFQQYRRQA